MPSIRPARLEDLEELLALIRAYYRFDGMAFRSRSIRPGLVRLLARPGLGRAWVAEHQGHLVAYALLTYNFDLEFGGLQGILTDLFVAARHRASGLGKRLLGEVERHCRRRRILSYELQVASSNTRAQRFYARAGFHRLHRRVMAKALRSGAQRRRR